MRKPLLFGLLLSTAAVCAQNATVSSTLVISQVYGGAGCGTVGCSSYKNDFIEIYNRGAAAVNLNGWSIQYAAAAGTAWSVTPLTNVTLQPGQYYLIAQGAGANGVNNIPIPDATGTVAMSATSAKIAIVSSTTALSGACPVSPTIVDFVGYGGSATCNEGGVNAPAPSTTTAATRKTAGCTETGNNGVDFAAIAPNPHNTSSALSTCITTPVNLSGIKAAYQPAKGVVISWQTASEQELSSFVVERSGDANRFTPIGRVSASGRSTGASYSFTDAQPLSAANYYRLKAEDRDGKATYSQVLSMRISSGSKLEVYPNPAINTLQVQFAEKAEKLLIHDASGRIVKSVAASGVGRVATLIDISTLENGIYYLTAGLYMVKFVKQ